MRIILKSFSILNQDINVDAGDARDTDTKSEFLATFTKIFITSGFHSIIQHFSHFVVNHGETTKLHGETKDDIKKFHNPGIIHLL